MDQNHETMRIDHTEISEHRNKTYDEVLEIVYRAFEHTENQDPLHNIIEYFVSGEPLYITRNNGARSLICKYDKYDLLSHIIESYYESMLKTK